MTWNEFLDRMREAGLEPHEEDFMDDYGLVATRKYAALRGRYFRCMFAATSTQGFQFETYVFPSRTDAKEFQELMGEGGGWQQQDNLVLHSATENTDQLSDVVRQALENPRGRH